MIEFIQQYLGSILVGAGVLAAVALIIVNAVRRRRAGKSSCGCDCANCGCHCANNNESFLHNTK